MSRRRLNNPLDLTELEFKEVSHNIQKRYYRLLWKYLARI